MLDIYSASAGSGKTHLLTNYYLRLLLIGNVDFRKILAVTFTNKATDEMKRRIIEELYQIAVNPQLSDFFKDLSSDKNKWLRLQNRANVVLRIMLHDYSSFSVSTIDKFFQQILRNFTREIGVNDNYTLELDTEKSLEIVIDRIYASLASKENTDLLRWLIVFSENKLEEGYSWNVKKDLTSLSRELFKETYRLHQATIQTEIENKEKLKEFGKEIKEIKHKFRLKLKKIGVKALAIMNKKGLTPEDFKGGMRSPFKIFIHLVNGDIPELKESFFKLHNTLSEWTAKNTDLQLVQAIKEAYEEGLNECVGELIDLFNTEFVLYNSADAVDQCFFKFALLGDISRHLSNYAQEKNLLFILDTTELLNKIVGNADAPFIYEKVGTRIDHYMIDEFQDTSKLQWQNFLPLLKESLSSHKKNLIVGDVKQSIYRFRNSDWQLLSKKVEADLNLFDFKRETLEFNWRSSSQIVAFNNHLFGWLKGMENVKDKWSQNALSSIVKEAYADVEQKIPPQHLKKTAGYVRLSFIENTKEISWKDEVLRRLPLDLENLQSRGISLRNIAILVRKKSEAALIAQTLLEYKQKHPDSPYKYDVVSDEALKINSSKAVQLILAALHYLDNPGSDTARFHVILQFERLKQQRSGVTDINVDRLLAEVNDKSFLLEIEKKAKGTLYEIVENLLFVYNKLFDDNDKIFLQSFLDIVLDFSSHNNQELSLFLEWWDKNGEQKNISIPDMQDAVRIMTIHKSKGLGFENVIIPFCDWKTDLDTSKDSILWCKTKTFPFNNFSFLPVKYSSKLINTVFEKEYKEERKYAFIDSLNTLYVAYTRAEKQMLIYTPLSKKIDEKDFSSVSNILSACFAPLSTMEVHFGQMESMKRQREFNQNEEKSPDLYYADKGSRLKLRLRQEISFDEKENKRGYGIFMHKVLSKIEKKENLYDIVREMYENGNIKSIQTSELITLLEKKLNNPSVRRWFDGSMIVYSERPVLSSERGIKIPDRVMFVPGTKEIEVVDYKFGEKEDTVYSKQIMTYCRLIKDMGFENVRGYLWYVSLDKVVCL